MTFFSEELVILRHFYLIMITRGFMGCKGCTLDLDDIWDGFFG